MNIMIFMLGRKTGMTGLYERIKQKDYAKKSDNLDKMDKFPAIYKLPKYTQE